MRLDIPAGTAVRFEPGETQDGAGSSRSRRRAVSHRIDRARYAEIYGPTTGDTVRLGDTDLVARIERDHTVYGDECKFGGGKVLRDRMGQAAGVGGGRRARPRDHERADHRLDRHLQGRHRHQARPDRRHRQGRQPGA